MNPRSRCRVGLSVSSVLPALPLKPQRCFLLAPSLHYPPKSMAASKSSLARLQGRAANTRIALVGLQFSCPALRFSCLPRGKEICEIQQLRLEKPWNGIPTGNALGIEFISLPQPKHHSETRGRQKARGDKEQKLLFSLQTVGPRANTDTNAGIRRYAGPHPQRLTTLLGMEFRIGNGKEMTDGSGVKKRNLC